MCGHIHPHPGVTPSALSITSCNTPYYKGKKTPLLPILPSLGTKRCIKLARVGQTSAASSRFDQCCKTCLGYNADALCSNYLTAEICSPLPHRQAKPWVGLVLIAEQMLSSLPAVPALVLLARLQDILIPCNTRTSSWTKSFFFSFLLLHDIARH